MLELIKVRVDETVHILSVYNNGVFELQPEEEQQLRDYYLAEHGKEIPEIGPFSLPDFLAYANEHKVLRKFSWESYFGIRLN